MALLPHIARRYRSFSSTVIARAMRLLAWRPFQRSSMPNTLGEPNHADKCAQKQQDDLNSIVNSHLLQVRAIEQRYAKQGYKITFK
jgi:hypothetical protein